MWGGLRDRASIYNPVGLVALLQRAGIKCRAKLSGAVHRRGDRCPKDRVRSGVFIRVYRPYCPGRLSRAKRGALAKRGLISGYMGTTTQRGPGPSAPRDRAFSALDMTTSRSVRT